MTSQSSINIALFNAFLIHYYKPHLEFMLSNHKQDIQLKLLFSNKTEKNTILLLKVFIFITKIKASTNEKKLH